MDRVVIGLVMGGFLRSLWDAYNTICISAYQYFHFKRLTLSSGVFIAKLCLSGCIVAKLSLLAWFWLTVRYDLKVIFGQKKCPAINTGRYLLV